MSQCLCQRLDELLNQYRNADAQEAETGLLETLSALATLDDTSLLPRFSVEQIWDDVSTVSSTSTTDSNTTIEIPIEGEGACANLWRAGFMLIGTLIRRLSPFELHTSSSQALIFSEDASSHFSALCLILCAKSLTQCPALSELKQWKRWQSMLCETIRMFQTFRIPEWELSLWMNYLLPTLESVKLPEEALHNAIAAGLIGTTLELIANHPSETGQCRPALERMMKSQEILSHPWKVVAFRNPDNEGTDSHCAKMRKADLVWWTECADAHDSVCSMDTSWSTKGLACWAWECWQNESASPQSSPQDTWNVYFPYVSNLILEDDLYRVGLIMLRDLLSVQPSRTMVEWQKVPTNPMGTLQLLSNKLVRASQEHGRQGATAMATLMQSLVEKYSPSSQVELVKQLARDCPYPGLQPKLLDMLRPLATTGSAHCPELWHLLQYTYLQEMLKHVDDVGGLLGVETLLDDVEIYVSAASMVQVFQMVTGNWPDGVEESTFETILAAGRAKWHEWENEAERPRGFHRLFLLLSTLERIEDLRRAQSESKTILQYSSRYDG